MAGFPCARRLMRRVFISEEDERDQALGRCQQQADCRGARRCMEWFGADISWRKIGPTRAIVNNPYGLCMKYWSTLATLTEDFRPMSHYSCENAALYASSSCLRGSSALLYCPSEILAAIWLTAVAIWFSAFRKS